MEELKMSLAAVLVTLLIATAESHGQVRARPHAARRSMPVVQALPMSKGGWRPVVGGAGFSGYSLLSSGALQLPQYKIPVPVAGDSYPTASKNSPARDSNKLTSIAQSYKPTTLRSLPLNNFNAPVNSYLNPFSLPNSGLSHYKIVQNYPMEGLVIRNPGSYQQRPIYSKYPAQISQNSINKFKQNQHHSAMLQQFAANNYHLYPTTVRNPHDQFSKPVEVYVRPTEAAKKPELYARPDSSKKTEYAKPGDSKKPELYKIPDSTGAQQSVNKQQVKTAQQALAVGTLKPPSSMPYQQYTFKDDKFSPIPPSILGSFGTYGFQSVKARDPAFFGTKTTYLPPAPTKYTVFNSFGYTPTLNTRDQFVTTTPKVKPSPNQIVYGNTFNGNVQGQQIKPTNAFESNVPKKGSFKASPQDPFAKPSVQPQIVSHQPQVSNFYNPFKLPQFPQQLPTYYTTIPTTTTDGTIFSPKPIPNRFSSQLNSPYNTFNSFYSQHTNLDYEKNQQTLPPTASTQDDLSQYGVYPTKEKPTIAATQSSAPFRATYDVTENYDIETQPPQISWLNSPDTYQGYSNQQHPAPTQNTEESDSIDIHSDEDSTKLQRPELPSSNTYATEANEKPYENSLNYEADVESQSRRPLGDDFEPTQYVGKHKHNEHHYRVTTPSYSSVEATTRYVDTSTDITTRRNNYREHNLRGGDSSSLPDQLPTLPPNKHFRRPNPEHTEKEKYRKKNKSRRRRPTANPAEKDEVSDHSTTVLPIEVYTTEADGTVHTVRPRIRVPVYGKPKQTTPTVTTDLSTSALPTLAPTTPTILRKKLSGRRTTTSSPNEEEYTTISTKFSENGSKGSSIMKIANRLPGQRATTYSNDFSINETPDYTHKQDEKDTPTSDIAVNTSEDHVNKNSNSADTFTKGFDFHVNVKPIDNKLEQYPSTEKLEAIPIDSKSHDDDSYDKNQETENDNEDTESTATTTVKVDVAQSNGKNQRPRPKNKYDNNRPRFSVKDYRNRLSSTTTTERSQDSLAPKLRFPQRRLPVYTDNKSQLDSDNTTEAPRKKFTPKDPRHKPLGSEFTASETTTEKHSFSTRSTTIRHRLATSSTEPSVSETITPRLSSRIRTNPRNPLRGKTSTTEDPIEQVSQTPAHIKRPLRKKHNQNVEKDSLSEPSEDFVVTESNNREQGVTSERYRSESAIMKIAKDEKKHQSNDNPEHALSEHSKRVSDLTLAASKDYNTPGMFKTVSPNSRRIPNYFTIATDDPILPIEAFFPQLNQKKES